MNKYKFEQIAINCTEKKIPTKYEYKTYIGLEHMDTGSLYIKRYGSAVPIIGEKLIMHKGDVLLGKRNAYLRRAAIAPHDGVFSAHGMILRPKTDVINPEFFPLFIASDYFFDEAIKISVGSLSPTINWKDLKDIEFNLPDLDEQKKLAEILWAMEDTIESYQKMITANDELLKAKLSEILSSKKYKLVTLRDCVDTKILSVKKKYAADDVIKYIDISSINSQKNQLDSYAEYHLKYAPSRAQQCLVKNDILVSTVRPNLKNIAVLKVDGNYVGSSGFCILRPQNYDVEYLKAIVLSDEFTNSMVNLTNGANYPAVRDKDILDYKIADIPITEQKKFAHLSLKIEKSKELIFYNLNLLNKMKVKLISKILKYPKEEN